jgi:hypothetical protein
VHLHGLADGDGPSLCFLPGGHPYDALPSRSKQNTYKFS